MEQNIMISRAIEGKTLLREHICCHPLCFSPLIKIHLEAAIRKSWGKGRQEGGDDPT